MKKTGFLLIMALIVALPLTAQRNKKRSTPKKKTPTVEVPQEDPRLLQMLEATQRIIFIDSVVVDKQRFLEQYKLSSETGKLMTYNEFFKQNDQPYGVVHMNELGNKAWFSKTGRLYTTDLLGGKEWNAPTLLDGLDDSTYTTANYPFMMADGITFYFAAQGPESIGGLDIFVTRYDSGKGRFLMPENIGMPFNSEANDYMIAFDEMNNLAYFATDRRQPEGQVCIYTFIPNQTRQTYEADDLDDKTLRSLANIERIADTWVDDNARKQAMERLTALRSQKKQDKPKNSDANQFTFRIDDNTVYHALRDFKNLDNRTRYAKLKESMGQLNSLEQKLVQQRKRFLDVKNEERDYLTEEILKNEQLLLELEQQVHQQEKTIRNSEINAIQQ